MIQRNVTTQNNDLTILDDLLSQLLNETTISLKKNIDRPHRFITIKNNIEQDLYIINTILEINNNNKINKQNN